MGSNFNIFILLSGFKRAVKLNNKAIVRTFNSTQQMQIDDRVNRQAQDKKSQENNNKQKQQDNRTPETGTHLQGVN
jgi:hypothetical protein